jgi:hypothetical protein
MTEKNEDPFDLERLVTMTPEQEEALRAKAETVRAGKTVT